MKIVEEVHGTRKGHWMYCPACQSLHYIGSGWMWNGEQEKATLYYGSIVVRSKKEMCHFYLKEGTIIYWSDCTHKFVNKKVRLPDIPPQYFPDRQEVGRESVHNEG